MKTDQTSSSRTAPTWSFQLVVLVILLAIAICFGINGMKINVACSNASPDLEFWLNRYQTLIGALATLVAGAVAWFAAQATIARSEKNIRSQRNIERIAVEARLPHAMTMVLSYTERFMKSISACEKMANDGQVILQTIDPLDRNAIDTLSAYIQQGYFNEVIDAAGERKEIRVAAILANLASLTESEGETISLRQCARLFGTAFKINHEAFHLTFPFLPLDMSDGLAQKYVKTGLGGISKMNLSAELKSELIRMWDQYQS